MVNDAIVCLFLNRHIHLKIGPKNLLFYLIIKKNAEIAQDSCLSLSSHTISLLLTSRPACMTVVSVMFTFLISPNFFGLNIVGSVDRA